MRLQKTFVALFLKLFVVGIFLCGFTVSAAADVVLADSWRRLLHNEWWKSWNLNWNLPYSRTKPFCWVILEDAGFSIFLSVLKVCGPIMKWLSSWRRLFLLNDYNSMAMSFVTKVNFWRRKRYRIWLDSFLYLSWFTATNADKHDRLLVLFVLNGIKETPVWQLDSVNAMFLNCLFSSIFLENSRVYFPFLFRDCWPVILGSVFLDVAVIRHDRTILRDHVCRFPKIKTETSKTVSLVLSVSKL